MRHPNRRPKSLAAAVLAVGLAGGTLLAGCGGSDRTAPERLRLAGGGAANGADAARDAASPAIYPIRPTEYVLAGELADLGTTADVHRLVARPVDDAAVRRFAEAVGLPPTGDNEFVRLADGSTWFGGPDGTAPLTPGGGSVTFFPGGPTPTVGFTPVADAPDAGRSEPGASGGGSAGTTGSAEPACGKFENGTIVECPPAAGDGSDDPVVSPPDPSDPPSTPTTVVDVPAAAEAERIARTVLTDAGALTGAEWDAATVDVTDSGGVATVCADRRIPCPSEPPVVTARTVVFSPVVDGVAVHGVSWSVTIGGRGALESVYGDWATIERVGSYDTVGSAQAFSDLQAGKATFPGPQPLAAENAPAVGDSEPIVVKVTGVTPGLMRWDAAGATPPVAYLVPTYRFAIEGGGEVEALALSPAGFAIVDPAPPATVEPQPKPTEPPAVEPQPNPTEPPPIEPRPTPVPPPATTDPGLAPEPVPDDDGTTGTKPVERPEIVGLTEVEARSALAEAGYELRVVERDGDALAVTRDYRSDRVNVAVVDGRVTAVEFLG